VPTNLPTNEKSFDEKLTEHGEERTSANEQRTTANAYFHLLSSRRTG
jgi:hypothetical protein